MPIHPWQVNQQRAVPAHGYISFTGNSADGETFSIGGRVYELDPLGVAAVGDVAITVANGANAVVTAAAVVVGINADAARTFDAVALGGTIVGLVARTPGVTLAALAETLGNGVVSGANTLGGAAESLLSLQSSNYVVTATDVTTLAITLGTSEITLASFPSTTAPRLKALAVRTAAGAIKDVTDGILTIRQANADQWCVCYAEPGGGALLVAGDTIDILVAAVGV